MVRKLEVSQQFKFVSTLRTKINSLSGTTDNWILLDVIVLNPPAGKVPAVVIPSDLPAISG